MATALEIYIREADAGDAVALAPLATKTFIATFGHLYTAENLAHHLEEARSEAAFVKYLQEGDTILVAFEGDALLGYVKFGAVKMPVAATANDCELHHLYIEPDAQGRGLGRMLMDAAMSHPRMRSADGVYIGVWEENLRAQRFYDSYGFSRIGEYTYYVGEHADREFILHRRMTAA